jgi:tetratricopeptide (TPR) repeat protein
MKSYILGLVLLVLPAAAQEKQSFTINVGTPEGQLLQAIGQETDDARKAQLAQDFLSKYPKHEGAGWVCSQLESILVSQKDYDKALAAGDATWANVPDMDLSYYALKAAVAKGDVEQVKTWAERTDQAARKTIAADGTPADDETKNDLEHAKQVNEYSGYALYVTALKEKDNPKNVIDLVDELEKLDVKSQYLPLVSGSYFAALGKAGEAAKVCTAAERMSVSGSKNAEAMLVAANCAWRAQRGSSVITYGNRALEAMNSRQKEQGMSDSEWATLKASIIGGANCYVGVGYSLEQKWGPANKALRAALPELKGDEDLRGTALFYLGLANYSLGKLVGDRSQMRQGLNFFQESASVKNPMQDQAERNARVIRQELGGK